MNHFSERSLNPRRRSDSSRVIWARNTPRGAVVFVHGYLGEPINTWTSFHSMLPARDKAKDYDLFFYGYDGSTGNTTAEGTFLCDFLNNIWTSPERLAGDSLPSEAARGRFRYATVVIVGHSLGAVICRRALLFARAKGYRWMPKTSMVLFAPAHRGAIPLEILKDLDNSWLRFVFGYSRYVSPLLRELEPGSQTIVQLTEDTTKALGAGAGYLIAKRVIIAQVERVVDNLPFLQDPVPIAIRGTTHNTVCKPNSGFLEPLDLVEQVL